MLAYANAPSYARLAMSKFQTLRKAVAKSFAGHDTSSRAVRAWRAICLDLDFPRIFDEALAHFDDAGVELLGHELYAALVKVIDGGTAISALHRSEH